MKKKNAGMIPEKSFFPGVLLCLVLCVAVLSASCAPQKALIDTSATNRIFWPGQPEKPRIAFLWSVSVIAHDAGTSAYDLLAGADGFADPTSSARLLRPYSIFVDEQGLLYITDTGAYRITVIDPKNAETRNILEAGSEAFLSPIGIVAFRGKIYVSDSVLKKVFILGADGKKIGEFEGELKRPTSLALDRNSGSIYVSDTLAHQIYRYDAVGKRLSTIGKNGSEDGEFHFPAHIWVDKSGRLFVTDTLNFRVQTFSADGSFEMLFGMLGDAYGNLEKPKGVATDSDGNSYVVDSIKDMVKIFDRQGKLLLFFGEQGQDFGQFWLPSGIFIDDRDYIYVADTYNGRVQVFRYLGNK